MYLPTRRHMEYIEYMKKVCSRSRLSLVLKGSLAHETAKPFSDIDLILLGRLNSNLLNDIISGYDKIVMTNFTENPKGICILNYKNGISVDLDIRETVLKSELDNEVVLCDYGFEIANVKTRKIIESDFMPERPQWYKIIRLIHRCCIKCLCQKTDAARGLADEVYDAISALAGKQTTKTGSIKQRMTDSFYCLCDLYDIDISIIELLNELFEKM